MEKRFSIKSLSLASLLALLVACGEKVPTEPVFVFPDEPAPTRFTRAYSLTESPDGLIRVFAKEDGDDTDLFEMHKQKDGSWSEPELMPFPHDELLYGPAFDPRDGTFYYASDEDTPWKTHGTDVNIWRVKRVDGEWGTPEVLPEIINTGARETSPAIDLQGNMYFASEHTRGKGGFDLYVTRLDPEDGNWVIESLPDTVNTPQTESHLAVHPDGKRVFFYSRMTPKLGVVDIFMLEKDEDGAWKAPQNLGPMINTKGIDFGPGVSGDGETFFFSREGRLMSVPFDIAIASPGLSENE